MRGGGGTPGRTARRRLAANEQAGRLYRRSVVALSKSASIPFPVLLGVIAAGCASAAPSGTTGPANDGPSWAAPPNAVSSKASTVHTRKQRRLAGGVGVYYCLARPGLRVLGNFLPLTTKHHTRPRRALRALRPPPPPHLFPVIHETGE